MIIYDCSSIDTKVGPIDETCPDTSTPSQVAFENTICGDYNDALLIFSSTSLNP